MRVCSEVRFLMTEQTNETNATRFHSGDGRDNGV